MFFNTQASADRHVVTAAVGGRRFTLGRLLAGAMLAALTSLAAWAGVAGGALVDGSFPLAELGLCLVGYLTATTAGTALPALFAQPLVHSRAIAG